MHAPLPWERILWTCRPIARPGARYVLTDLRLYAARGRRVEEIALLDIGEVECSRSRLDRLIGTSTIVAHPRERRRSPVVMRHVRQGAALAALVDLLSGDPHASLDAAGVRDALAWNPKPGRGGRQAFAAMAAVVAGLFAVTAGLHSSTPPRVAYASDDPIYPGGRKRDRAAIVAFMESAVMPWARTTLGRIKGGPDNVTCGTCHGEDPERSDWAMPSVAALPEPLVRGLGWEIHSASMDAQMRNAIYGYRAESDNQARAAFMREAVMPGMARLLHRPAYDFTRSYEYNRTRAAFGCYHCHRVK